MEYLNYCYTRGFSRISFSLFFQVFLVLLSLLFFGKSFTGSYMKSAITSIERRFDLPSAVVGTVDSGFEIGVFFVTCMHTHTHTQTR